MKFNHENFGIHLEMDDEELFFVGALAAAGLFLLTKNKADINPQAIAGFVQKHAPRVIDAVFKEVSDNDD